MSDILAKRAWKKPNDYFGFSPVGDYLIASVNRDSSALERSNFECLTRDLMREAESCTDDERAAVEDNQPANMQEIVYTWRAHHWAVGWVEYLMVSQLAPQRILDSAAEMLAALADYPVYDESHFSDLEWNEAAEYWARMSVRDRAELIRESRCGASIFAARRDEIPQDDCGALFERLRG